MMRSQRFFLALCMQAVIVLAAYTVSQTWAGVNPWRFVVIAGIAGVVAAPMAMSRIGDGFAMAFSGMLGIGVVWWLNAAYSGQIDGPLSHQLRAYPNLVIDALVRGTVTEANRTLAAETLLSVMIWITSWMAMWILLGVNGSWLALLAPWVLVFTNQYATGADFTNIIIWMMGLSLGIIAMNRMRVQRARWDSRAIPVAKSIAVKLFTAGLIVAIITSSVVAATPPNWSQTILQPMIHDGFQRFDAARIQTSSWFGELFGDAVTPGASARYTEFSDGFSIGGPLSLSAEPEVTVRVNTVSPPYLKARIYDEYTGRGWASSMSTIGAVDGGSTRNSPLLRYKPDWSIALSADARNERERIVAYVTPLHNQNTSIFSVESYYAADVQAVVQMGWMTVDHQSFAVSVSELSALPPDVQLLGSLLLQSQLDGQATDQGPSANSPMMQEAIDAELADLRRRGIDATWTASPDGLVLLLYVSGRLPVFDDVEAVFTTEPGSAYSVSSLVSVAEESALMNAGDNYPDWVMARYLAIGPTVTDRTLDLTREIVGNEVNPYLQAKLIEQWLRTNIIYDDTVAAPPKGQDLVDHVLFEHRYGYCEHYSAAMVVMLRSLGVPSRVAVGYAPGEWDEASGSYIYRQNNAHAWVEVYFLGYGWIPFEPTASQPLGEFSLDTSEPGNPESLDDTQPTPTAIPVPTAPIATPDVAADNQFATPQPTTETVSPLEKGVPNSGTGGSSRWLIPTIGLMMTAGAIAGGSWLVWHWSLRGLSPAGGLMKRLQRIGGWCGIRMNPTVTPRELSREFDEQIPSIGKSARSITRAYEIETFGSPAAREHRLEEARLAWLDVKHRLIGLLRTRKKKGKS